jgi:hypothetical protein
MSSSRKLRIEDITNTPIEKEQYSNLLKNLNQIPINQQEYGNKRKIKP